MPEVHLREQAWIYDNVLAATNGPWEKGPRIGQPRSNHDHNKESEKDTEQNCDNDLRPTAHETTQPRWWPKAGQRHRNDKEDNHVEMSRKVTMIWSRGQMSWDKRRQHYHHKTYRWSMVINKSPGDAKWQPRYVHKSMKEMPMAAKIWVKGRKPEKITEGQQQQRSNNTQGLSDRPLIDHYCPDSDPSKTKWKNKTVIAPCLHWLQSMRGKC